MEKFDSMLSPVIDSTLGQRCSSIFGYQFSERVRSLMSVYFCGGSCAVEVSLETGKVLKMHMEGASIHGSTVMTKSFEDIEAIILEEYPDAQEIIITTGQDGNNTYYDAVFVTGEFAAEAKINPVTGAFSEREYVFF